MFNFIWRCVQLGKFFSVKMRLLQGLLQHNEREGKELFQGNKTGKLSINMNLEILNSIYNQIDLYSTIY